MPGNLRRRLVKARNVSPVKINEFANGATESFIELLQVTPVSTARGGSI